MALTSFAIGSGNQSKLLEFTTNAHRASREAIRTCYCRLKFDGVVTYKGKRPPKNESIDGRFWYRPGSVRGITIEGGELETDYLIKDGVRYSVSRDVGSGKLVGAGRDQFENRYVARGDAFIRGLIVVNIPNTLRYVPFEEFLDQATKVLTTERKKISSEEVVIVRCLFEKTNDQPVPWEVELHFDPSTNYLIRRVICSFRDQVGKFVRQDEVTHFKECAPGVFCPERVEGFAGYEGEPYFKHKTVISDIQVNQPVPDERFTMRFPGGVDFVDRIRGTYYRVDPGGNAISAETPLTKAIPPPSVEPGGKLTLGSESEDEPKSFVQWLLPTSVGILLLAGLFALLRRWRRPTPA